MRAPASDPAKGLVDHTDDATLVCRKEDAERVEGMVERLRADGDEALL